jgi:hypothetical protein
MWRFLRDDSPATLHLAGHMLAFSIVNAGPAMYIVNSLRNLMKAVTLQKEPYETVFAVMSAIYRC